jgi:soluble lytic murein transglycosylase-like protein
MVVLYRGVQCGRRRMELVDDVVVPALLVAQQGYEVVAPAVRSRRVRAAVAVPLVALVVRPHAGDSQATGRSKPAWPYAATIRREARRASLPPDLVAAVVAQESGFDRRAYNHGSGARGLMQLSPSTVRMLGVTDPTNARQSLGAGCQYLRSLLDRFHGHISLALAAYDAGPTLVEEHSGIPDFPETRRYVAQVLARYRAYRRSDSRLRS